MLYCITQYEIFQGETQIFLKNSSFPISLKEAAVANATAAKYYFFSEGM